MPNKPPTLPDQIRQARLGAGLSQMALAVRLGVDTSTVSKWERGLSVPSDASLEAIARETGCRFQPARIVTLVVKERA